MPCYATSPGASIDTTIDKAIAIIGASAGNGWDGVSVRAYLGISTLPAMTGFKQVASATGASFYVSGGGAATFGFRYVLNDTSDFAVGIVGQFSGEPGYLDARGVGIYGGTLYGTSGDVGYTAVFKIGGVGALPVSHTG